MPRPHPPEFRQRPIQLARERVKPIAVIAADLGISESCLRGWLHEDDVDDGNAEGPATSECAELVQLRRENRGLEMEKEIPGKATAFFANEGNYSSR